MKIKVLVCEPNKHPTTVEIESNFESIQKVVGGWIDVIDLGEAKLLYCNENASRNGSKFNRIVRGHAILGIFLIAKINSDGYDISLSESEIISLTAELIEANNNNN